MVELFSNSEIIEFVHNVPLACLAINEDDAPNGLMEIHIASGDMMML